MWRGRREKMDPFHGDDSGNSSTVADNNLADNSQANGQGRALQLIHFETPDDGTGFKMHLNEETLEIVIKSTKNRPLAILTIAGQTRQGKSFLLNHGLRSLEKMESDDTDWMDWENPSRSLTGFQWKHGSAKVTSGVWVWSRAFLVDVAEDEIAVVVLDTEGFSEGENSSREIETIIGLCMLSSSVTLLNFSNTLPDNFTALSTVLEFGLHCSENVEGRKKEPPFQKLSFLIRDWPKSSHHTFGMKGGKAYLAEKMQILKAGAKGKAGNKLKKIREAFSDCFHSVDCCLFPNIGENALKQSSTGAIADFEADFSKVLETFIDEIISAEGLQIKKILGTAVHGDDFVHFLRAYVNLLNAWNVGELEFTPEELWNVSGNVLHENVVRKAMDKFEEAMNKRQKGKRYLLTTDMESVCVLAKREALAIFKKAKKQEDFAEEHEKILKQKLENAVQNIKMKNEQFREDFVGECTSACSQKFGEELQKKFPFRTHEGIIIFYQDDIIRQQSNNHKKLTIETFLSNFLEESDENQAALVESFAGVLEGILRTVLEKNTENTEKAEKFIEEAMEKLMGEYTMQLNNFIRQYPLADNSNLNVANDFIMKNINTNLMKLPGSTMFKEEYKTRLDSKSKQIFLDFETNQKGKVAEQLNLSDDLLEAQGNAYFHSLKSLAKKLESEEELLAKHTKALPKLLQKFEQKISFPEGSPQREGLIHKHKVEIQGIFERVRDECIVLKRFRAECENAMDESFNLYRESFGTFVESMEFFEDEEMKARHMSDTMEANNHLENAINSRSEAQNKIKAEYMENLTKSLEDRFETFRRDNDDVRKAAVITTKQLVDECQNVYNDKMTSASRNCKNLQWLEHTHAMVKVETLSFFTARCGQKNKKFIGEYAEQLSRIIELNFDEARDIFEMQLNKEEGEVKAALYQVRNHYHTDMKVHFENNKFMTPDKLQCLHEQACKAAVNNSHSKSKLNQFQLHKLTECLEDSFAKYKMKNEMLLNWDPTVEPAIGIDLGTTYSCVGIFFNGRVEIIRNDVGANTTPSYVSFNADMSTTVGQPAKDEAYLNPENTIFDAKRMIGRDFYDTNLQNDMKYWPFEVVRGDPSPVINIRGVSYPPEQISSILLKHFKMMAETYLGRPVKKAVITVPAYFNDGQRQATRDAGEIARLEVLTILNEPTAAAIAYQMQRFDEEARKVLVFDLGGGTFDVAVLETVGGSIEVLGVDGDTHLGGEDFDKELMKYCVAEFQRQHRVDLLKEKDSSNKLVRDEARKIIRRLQTQCEKNKQQLSARRETTVTLDAFRDGRDLKVEIKQSKFLELNMQHFQKAIDIVKRALSAVGVQKEEINDIVLVGGSTKIPKIQDMLTDYFQGRALSHVIHPDEAVAYGAAVQAAMLNGRNSLGFTTIRDVIPMSLGIEAVMGEQWDAFSRIVPRNTRFPSKHKKPYTTFSHNQTSIKIKIYQGENSTAAMNTYLGQFMIDGIPAGPAGREQIDVVMDIDSMGIVHVTAVCRSTKGSKTLTVESNKGRLSESDKRRLRDEGSPRIINSGSCVDADEYQGGSSHNALV